MKKNLIITILLVTGIAASAQKFSTKSGRISFFSSAPLENIEAINKTSAAVLDAGSGDVQFTVLMKGFEFRKALMQEHFNGKFVESDKFPRATFKGTVINNSSINYSADGTYPVTVKGQLKIHGVEKPVEYPGNIIVQGGKIIVNSTFSILLADYNISIPKMYRDNISKSIRVTVSASMNRM